MGHKPSAPAAPDYAPIAQADEQAANQQYQLGEQQLQMSQNEYNQIEPYAQQYLQQETQSSAAATAEAQQQEQVYNQNTLPAIEAFQKTASNYDSPAMASEQAGNAMADVASTFDANRTSALNNLESYGIDPSQTRYSALDLSSRISQAAATAAAGTQSNINTQGTGLALQGEAINMGMGLQNNVAGSYASAQGAGTAGLAGMNSVASTATQGNVAGSNIIGAGTQSNAGAASALDTGFNNNLAGAQFTAQMVENEDQGIGMLVGDALSMFGGGGGGGGGGGSSGGMQGGDAAGFIAGG